MATETHKVTRKGGSEIREIKSNNPARNNTIRIKPTSPPTAGNFSGSGVKTQYHSVKTGQRVSKSGAKLKGKSGLPGKLVGKSPYGRAATTVGSSLKKRVHLPHSDKRTGSPIMREVNRTPVLIAEYVIALILIGMHGTGSIARNGYEKSISGIMLRYTAVTGIWFILFLLSTSKKGSTFAAAFGGLIDIAILLGAANSGVFADVTAVIQGQPISNITLTDFNKSNKPTEFYATQEVQKAGKIQG